MRVLLVLDVIKNCLCVRKSKAIWEVEIEEELKKTFYKCKIINREGKNNRDKCKIASGCFKNCVSLSR